MEDNAIRNSQPGLEVHYQEAPIATDPKPAQYPEVSEYQDQGKPAPMYGQYTGYSPPEDQHYSEAPVKTSPNKKRLRWIIIGVAALVLIAVAGVVGGVIGYKMKSDDQKSTEDDKTTSPPSTNGTIPASTKIRANSQLGATGYYFGKDYRIQIFYQGPEDRLRYSVYQTGFEKWTTPQEVNAAAIPGTPFGAATLAISPNPDLPPSFQTEVFFISTPNRLSGQNWRDGFDAAGLSDSISKNSITLAPETQMGAYWPSIITQTSSGTVQETFFNASTASFSGPLDLPVEGSPGSSLLALPRDVNHSAGEQTPLPSMRIIYRNKDGQLVAFDRDRTGTQVSTSGSLPVSLGENAAIAGFATARSGTVGAVNTWVLYQATDGSIEYVFQDDDTGWKGPRKDPVFDGADNPTHITCVTASSMGAPSVPLISSNNISNCFFQVGKALRQVHFDGTKWVTVGFVPIP